MKIILVDPHKGLCYVKTVNIWKRIWPICYMAIMINAITIFSITVAITHNDLAMIITTSIGLMLIACLPALNYLNDILIGYET